MIDVGADGLEQLRSRNAFPIALITLGLKPTEYLTDSAATITKDGITYQSSEGLGASNAQKARQSLADDEFILTFLGTEYKRKFQLAGEVGVPLQISIFFRDGKIDTKPKRRYTGYSAGGVSVVENEDGNLVTVAPFIGKFSVLRGDRMFIATENNQAFRDPKDDGYKYIHRAGRQLWGERVGATRSRGGGGRAGGGGGGIIP